MIEVRPAGPEHVPEILRLVRQLAKYEREPDAVAATPEHLTAALFPSAGAPLVHAQIAVCDDSVVGIAIWFVSFSTWEGQHGIYLEDLFVEAEHRGRGVGRALLADLAGQATRRGYRRLEWSVLDWNEPARRFYRAIGAVEQTQWLPNRLAGAALQSLAEQAS